MARFLTHDEWLKVKLPFTYLKIAGFSDLPKIHVEMLEKWIEANGSGWVYREGATFVFESKSDMLMFSIWLKSDPFAEDQGDLVPA